MFDTYTKAQYRALSPEAFEARKQEVIDLMNADALPEGVTDEMLYAEADMIEADAERRSRANKLHNAKVEAVVQGMGNVVAASQPSQARSQGEVRDVTDVRGFSDSIEYRRELARALSTRSRLSDDTLAKLRQERATQDIDIPGTYSTINGGTFTNESTNLVAIPLSVSQGFERELRELTNIYNRVNHTSVQGQYAVDATDLTVQFTWLGSNDQIVSDYQGDGDIERFFWKWNMLEARFSRTFLAEALLRDDYKSLLSGAFAEGFSTQIDAAILRGTGNMMPIGILKDEHLIGTDGEGLNGTGGGKALIIDVTDDQIDDWKFWSSILFNDDFNMMYANSGELIMSRGTWGNHVNVLHDDNNAPIALSNPLTESHQLTLRGVGPVDLVPSVILPTYDNAQTGDIFGIYGNLKNYTINTQPGMPLSTVTWDDHENNAHKTKVLVTLDGRVHNRYGWVFLRKGAGA